MKRMIQGILLAASLMWGGAAFANDQAPKGSQARAAQGDTVERLGFTVPTEEKAFLERLHHINQMEIDAGKLAQQNALSQEVKAYGEMLVREHTQADEKLMTYARSKGLKLSKPKPMNATERKAMEAQKAKMEELRALRGQPFDAAFLATMLGDHDLALGKVLAGQLHFTQLEVSSLLQQHAQAITRHRQQAHTLLERIGPGAAAGVGGAGDFGQEPEEVNP